MTEKKAFLCHALWHEVERAPAKRTDCKVEFVHRVAEKASGRDHLQTKHKLIAEHYSAGLPSDLFDVCVSVCVRTCSGLILGGKPQCLISTLVRL